MDIITNDTLNYKFLNLYGTGNYNLFSLVYSRRSLHPELIIEIAQPKNIHMDANSTQPHLLLENFKANFGKLQKMLIDFFTLGHILYLIASTDNTQKQLKNEQDFFTYLNEDLSYRQSLPMLMNEINLNFKTHRYGYLYQLLTWLCSNFKKELVGCTIQVGSSHSQPAWVNFPIAEEVRSYYQSTKADARLNLKRVENFYNDIVTAITVFIRTRNNLLNRPNPTKAEISSLINFNKDSKAKLFVDTHDLIRHFEIRHITLWAYLESGMSNHEIKTILRRFSKNVRAKYVCNGYVKKVSYNHLTGLQIDFLDSVFSVSTIEIEQLWSNAVLPLFPTALCTFYKQELPYLGHAKEIAQFVESAISIPLLQDTELMLKVPTVRNFTTSRK